MELTLEVSAVATRRFKELAKLRGSTIEFVAASCLEAFTNSAEIRREILKGSGKAAMPGLGWIEDYSGQSVDEILALESSESADNLLMILEEAIGKKLDRFGPGTRSGIELTILLVMALQRDVNNGGFDQYYRNSSCRYAEYIAVALQSIGCKASAKICRKAYRALKIPKHLEVKKHYEALKNCMNDPNGKRDEKLEECDQEFYKLNEIPGALLAYAKANASGIRLNP